MKNFNSLGVLGRIGNRVYQRTARGHGNIAGDPAHSLQNRTYVPHNPSHSPAQQAAERYSRQVSRPGIQPARTPKQSTVHAAKNAKSPGSMRGCQTTIRSYSIDI